MGGRRRWRNDRPIDPMGSSTTTTRSVTLGLGVRHERGFAGATLEQIAAQAGVTRGALYHHFAGKAEVYEAVLRSRADEVVGPLLARLAGDGAPLDRLRTFLTSYCHTLERDRHFRQVLELVLFGAAGAPPESRQLTAQGYMAWLGAFRDLLQQARDRGEVRAGLTPTDVARAVLAVAVGVTTATLQAPDLFSPSEAAAPLIDALFQGIAA